MLSDAMQDVTAQEITPVVGKVALGTWRALKRSTGVVREESHAEVEL